MAILAFFGKGYLHRGNHSGLALALTRWHLGGTNSDFGYFKVFYEAVSCDLCYVNCGGYGLSSCFEGYFFEVVC